MDRLIADYPDPERHSEQILDALARLGTPLMFCELQLLGRQYQALEESLRRNWQPHLIAYSFKTNYDVARAQVFQNLGGWAEVVSGREYQMARSLGYQGCQIIFNGPHKTDTDLNCAVKEGALINVNDHDELERLISLARQEEFGARIGLRVSSTLENYGHSRFGFSLENGEAVEAVRGIAQRSEVQVIGLHNHLHGDVDQPEIYEEAIGQTAQFACEHLSGTPGELKYIDVGGGFPAKSTKPYSRSDWRPQPIDAYVSAVASVLSRYFPDPTAKPILIVEPGRYLTNDAVILISEVVHVGKRDEKQVANCNGSISMVPLTHYRPQLIGAYDSELKPCARRETMTSIYGATCRENDTLYEGRFPELKTGDLLVHFGVGAYNSTLSPDFIFDRPSMEML